MPEGHDMYLELPANFQAPNKSDSVLKLKKSLYGSIFAPKLFYEKLSKGLEDRGFVKSRMDPCMFISKKVVVQCYVDDLNIYSPETKYIDALLKSFAEDGDEYNWEMTSNGTVSEFLGIDIFCDGDNWEFTQSGLIQNILSTTGMLNIGASSKSSPTNSDGRPLGSDKYGPSAKEPWSYKSVIGMLLYLAGNSRPDIAFAVHQCARFSHSPKVSHEQAVLCICRYLLGTMDKGIIYTPSKELSVDCYVDADFAGLYGTETSDDPICAKSRTGYIILLANCPLLWVSKLQTEVTLSTLESKFVALSQSFRSLIAVQDLLAETLKGLDIPVTVHSRIKSTVFEDNSGCLKLAMTKRLTPRTRHIAVKYFWFLEKIDQGLAEVVKVDTKLQKADIFTKSLQPQPFISIRKLLCGW